MNSSFFYCLIILIFCAQGLFSQDSLSAKLNKIKNKYSLVGMSVAVTKNNQMVYNKGFGIKDLTRNLAIDDSTAYRIASISKMIAATALMQLWEKGKFKLDDNISNYIGFELKNPFFPSDVVSFRKLLSHTSSLRDGTGYSNFLAAIGNNPPPPISSLLVSGGSYYTSDMWSSTKRPTSNYFAYANVNFGVVGTLVEKLSGERFDIYCKNHIFAPLNISGSFNVNDIVNINNVAVLYRKSGAQWVPQVHNFQGVKPPPRDLTNYTIGTNGAIFGPQGNLIISSFDLAKLMLIHSNNGILNGIRILDQNTCDTMHKAIWSYNGSNGDNYYGIFNSYSLGCSRTTNLITGATLIGHPGEAYGLISDLYYEKDGQFGIIFITNGGVWSDGTYSGWYNVEEEIYQACKSEINNLTSVLDDEIVPDGFILKQNYPNPFNSTTLIDFSTDKSVQLEINVYNTLGMSVIKKTNQFFTSGSHKIKLDFSNFSSGNYFCKINVNSETRVISKTIKMTYLR